LISNFSMHKCLAELVGILHCRNCKIRNNHLQVVLKLFCNFHTRKSIGRHQWASFLFSYARKQDR